MSRILDTFTSKGLQHQLFAAMVFALALAGFACTICAKANGQEPLNVSAIAGRPATAASEMPSLNVSAIARSEKLCTCPGCRCEAPHQCGDPGCTCSARAATAEPAQPLNLSQLSPRRAQEKPKPDPTPAQAQATKPRQPHYELRNICHGGYCVRQWVLVQ